MYYEDSNIFDNIITTENSLTELFKNYLRFKIFRELFIELIIPDIDKTIVNHDCFQTQLYTEKNGIPDLVFSTEDIEFIFEIKVHNTPLTRNQPLGYLEYLKAKNKPTKGLFLIAPENYCYRKDFFDKLPCDLEEQHNIQSGFVSWQNIISLISSNELDETSPLFGEYLYYLNYWFKTLTIDKITVNIMYSKDFPDSIKTICDLIDKVSTSEKLNTKIHKSNSGFMGEYGYYVKNIEDSSLFFGIWFPYWKATGNPFTICLKSDNTQILSLFSNKCEELKLPKPTTSDEYENWSCTYVRREILDEKDCDIIISNLIDTFREELSNQ